MININDLENFKSSFQKNKNQNSVSHVKGRMQEYIEMLSDRKIPAQLLDQTLDYNNQRKELIRKMERIRFEQNTLNQKVMSLKKRGEKLDSIFEHLKNLSNQVKEFKDKLEKVEEKMEESLFYLPNFCHSTVPRGSSEEENEVVRTYGDISEKNFEAQDHSILGKNLEGFDFSRASKVSGSRFVFLKKSLAKMERVLIQFMMKLHTEEHGYEEIAPPFIVNTQSLFHSGHFPKFKEDVFSLTETDYHLIPTAEVPLTNYHSKEILKQEELPKAYVSYTPCFRSEAGSYGKDTKGLLRQHQFHKVELFYLSTPDRSFEILELLTSHAENVLKKLELPYRVSNLCRGELGFSSAKCYDLEVWFPGQKAYREVSSCSNCLDFQARRSSIRFRPSSSPSSKPQFVHTLNGSGLAVGRTLMAILENYQQKDGSVVVPKVLQDGMGSEVLS